MSDPQVEYSKRLETYQALVAAKNRVHIRVGNFKLAVVAAGLLLAWLSLVQHSLPSYWLLVPIGLYVILAIFHERTLRARSRAETAAAFYRKGLARIEDRWASAGQPCFCRSGGGRMSGSCGAWRSMALAMSERSTSGRRSSVKG